MNEFLTNIPLIQNLTDLVVWLLLFNVVLTGAVILFAFRASQYKLQAEELEGKLNDAIGATITRESPEPTPINRRGGRR